jgi:hypothetical protein
MAGSYGPPWLTHEYSEHSQDNSSYYYCLSPAHRYLHDTLRTRLITASFLFDNLHTFFHINLKTNDVTTELL